MFMLCVVCVFVCVYVCMYVCACLLGWGACTLVQSCTNLGGGSGEELQYTLNLGPVRDSYTFPLSHITALKIFSKNATATYLSDLLDEYQRAPH